VVELRLRIETTASPTKKVRPELQHGPLCRRDALGWLVGLRGVISTTSRGKSFHLVTLERNESEFQHSQVALIIEIRGDDFLNNIPKISLVLFELPR
jgi:hypothetical protein